MAEFLSFLNNVIFFVIDLLSIGVVISIFVIIGLAVNTILSNRTPRWDLLLFITVILLAALGLLRWYPQHAMAAVRSGLENSRPEAQLLRQEMQQWLPSLPEGAGEAVIDTSGEATIISTSPPSSVPTEQADAEPDAEVGGGMPLPTKTPRPTRLPTSTPMPTPTYDPLKPPTPCPWVNGQPTNCGG